MTWLRSKFFQAVLVLVIVFVLFRFGIRPPAPWSVVTLYMTIVLIAVFVYVSSDSDSWRNFLAPIHSTLVDDSKRPIRFALMVLIPLVVGYYAYSQAAARIEAPAELRAIHPAPPGSISFKGTTLDVQGLDNPLRKDAANFRKHVAEGAVIYIKNCVYCHGEKGDADSPAAPQLDPKPRDFTKGKYKVRTSASGKPPTDSDLFGVISDGMPGTSMPAWKVLSEKDRSNLVAYVKSFAGGAFKEPPKAAELPKEVAASKASIAR